MEIGYRFVCDKCRKPLIDYLVVGQLIETIRTITIEESIWRVYIKEENTTYAPTKQDAMQPLAMGKHKQFIYCKWCKEITKPQEALQTYFCMCGNYITECITGGHFDEVARDYNIHFCKDCKHLINGLFAYVKIAEQLYTHTASGTAINILKYTNDF